MPKLSPLENDIMNRITDRFEQWVIDSIALCKMADMSDGNVVNTVMTVAIRETIRMAIDARMPLEVFQSASKLVYDMTARKEAKNERG